jgi:DNA-binding response OmpR family regulator
VFLPQRSVAAESHRGSGLGLAIAANAVHRMNGTIEAKAGENGGLQIVIGCQKRRDNMEKILIIEDDTAIAAIERDYLEIDHFDVEIAPDGKSGMEKALQGGFDLILLDLMLPGMDGFTVCRELREALDIPILMVTARREDVDKIRGLGLAADDYIEKPFSPSVMVARVKAHLARYARLKQTGKAAPTQISIGNIRINTDTHRSM